MSTYRIKGETLENMADKIRILNGVEGALTTAQMDSNLEVANTNIESAFNAIGNKGGIVPQSKVSGNLKNAINSIPKSDINITLSSINVSDDSNGNITIN